MKTQVLQLLLCKYNVPFATGDTAMDLPVCKITAEGQSGIRYGFPRSGNSHPSYGFRLWYPDRCHTFPSIRQRHPRSTG